MALIASVRATNLYPAEVGDYVTCGIPLAKGYMSDASPKTLVVKDPYLLSDPGVHRRLQWHQMGPKWEDDSYRNIRVKFPCEVVKAVVNTQGYSSYADRIVEIRDDLSPTDTAFAFHPDVDPANTNFTLQAERWSQVFTPLTSHFKNLDANNRSLGTDDIRAADVLDPWATAQSVSTTRSFCRLYPEDHGDDPTAHPSLLGILVCEYVHNQPWVKFWFSVTNSFITSDTPSERRWGGSTWAVTSPIKFTIDGVDDVAIRFERGLVPSVSESGGVWTIQMNNVDLQNQRNHFGNGYKLLVKGMLLYGDPATHTQIQQDTRAMHKTTNTWVTGCCLNWPDHGSYGYRGIVPQRPTNSLIQSDADALTQGYVQLRWMGDVYNDGARSPWRKTLTSLNKRPSDTGEQPDFGVVEHLMCARGGCADMRALEFEVTAEARRPHHYYNADGAHWDPTDYTSGGRFTNVIYFGMALWMNTIGGSGQDDVFKMGKFPLGNYAPRGEKPDGWDYMDAQHPSHNSIGHAAMLTGETYYFHEELWHLEVGTLCQKVLATDQPGWTLDNNNPRIWAAGVNREETRFHLFCVMLYLLGGDTRILQKKVADRCEWWLEEGLGRSDWHIPTLGVDMFGYTNQGGGYAYDLSNPSQRIQVDYDWSAVWMGPGSVALDAAAGAFVLAGIAGDGVVAAATLRKWIEKGIVYNGSRRTTETGNVWAHLWVAFSYHDPNNFSARIPWDSDPTIWDVRADGRSGGASKDSPGTNRQGQNVTYALLGGPDIPGSSEFVPWYAAAVILAYEAAEADGDQDLQALAYDQIENPVGPYGMRYTEEIRAGGDGWGHFTNPVRRNNNNLQNWLGVLVDIDRVRDDGSGGGDDEEIPVGLVYQEDTIDIDIDIETNIGAIALIPELNPDDSSKSQVILDLQTRGSNVDISGEVDAVTGSDRIILTLNGGSTPPGTPYIFCYPLGHTVEDGLREVMISFMLKPEADWVVTDPKGWIQFDLILSPTGDFQHEKAFAIATTGRIEGEIPQGAVLFKTSSAQTTYTGHLFLCAEGREAAGVTSPMWANVLHLFGTLKFNNSDPTWHPSF